MHSRDARQHSRPLVGTTVVADDLIRLIGGFVSLDGTDVFIFVLMRH